MKRNTLAAALGLSLLASASAVAGNIADFTTPTVDFSNNNNWTLGFEFHVNSPITITGLSIYDDRKDGLATTHDAGLWTSGGTLLASTVIPAGTAAPLVGWFRVQSISAVTLGVGDYVVGARTEFENYTWNPIGFSTIPQVTFLVDKFSIGGGLNFPTSSSGLVGFFGGNASTGVTVPDNGNTVALLGASVLGLAALRRKLA